MPRRAVPGTGAAAGALRGLPRGIPVAVASTVRRIQLGGELIWTASTNEEIARAIGQPIPPLPGHAELYAQVLAFGGGVTREIWRPVFEAFLVAQLPPPHNPASCQHIGRFRELEARAKGRPWVRAEVGRRFLSTLTPADLKVCRFHTADWKAGLYA